MSAESTTQEWESNHQSLNYLSKEVANRIVLKDDYESFKKEMQEVKELLKQSLRVHETSIAELKTHLQELKIGALESQQGKSSSGRLKKNEGKQTVIEEDDLSITHRGKKSLDQPNIEGLEFYPEEAISRSYHNIWKRDHEIILDKNDADSYGLRNSWILRREILNLNNLPMIETYDTLETIHDKILSIQQSCICSKILFSEWNIVLYSRLSGVLKSRVSAYLHSRPKDFCSIVCVLLIGLDYRTLIARGYERKTIFMDENMMSLMAPGAVTGCYVTIE